MDEPDADSDSELSGLRIRNITHLRRGATRTRSYFIIGAGGCLMLIAELIPRIINAVRAIGQSHLITDLIVVGTEAVIVLASIAGAAFCIRKSITLTRELHQPLLEEPDNPPDFSNLSDGSQHVRDLEKMLEEEPEN